MANTNNTVKSLFINSISTKVTEKLDENKQPIAGTRKEFLTQTVLKKKDFTSADNYSEYKFQLNRFNTLLADYSNNEANSEKTVSKTALLNGLELVAKSLKLEGIDFQPKNFHVSYLLKTCFIRKISKVTEKVELQTRSSGIIQREVETVVSLAIQGLPMPTATINNNVSKQLEKAANDKVVKAEKEKAKKAKEKEKAAQKAKKASDKKADKAKEEKTAA